MQNDEHSKKREKPYSALGHLEQYLLPGEEIDLRITRHKIYDNVPDHPRFAISFLVEPGDDVSWDDTVIKRWYVGNTISACLKNLISDAETKRPMTEDEFKMIAAEIAKGSAITEAELMKFKKYLESGKVSIL